MKECFGRKPDITPVMEDRGCITCKEAAACGRETREWLFPKSEAQMQAERYKGPAFPPGYPPVTNPPRDDDASLHEVEAMEAASRAATIRGRDAAVGIEETLDKIRNMDCAWQVEEKRAREAEQMKSGLRASMNEVAERAAADAMNALQPALHRQEGGSHYKEMTIQPVEFIHGNNIPFIEGCCIKYLCRWRSKGGLEDLKKVKHFVDLLIELESPTRPTK